MEFRDFGFGGPLRVLGPLEFLGLCFEGSSAGLWGEQALVQSLGFTSGLWVEPQFREGLRGSNFNGLGRRGAYTVPP